MEYEGGFVMTGTIRVVDQGITTMNPATFDYSWSINGTFDGRSEHSSKFQKCWLWN
jgi:hypothetical protein